MHIFKLILLAFILFSCSSKKEAVDESLPTIEPYKERNGFWQYKGKPVMLLGANKTDSPYLLPDQEDYYNQLSALDGNYTRYVVKQRLEKGLEPIFPFKKTADGRYDLDQWNEEYWKRFEAGLEMTAERDIVLQME